MKIENMLFSPLKNWVENSTANWNTLIGVGFVLFVIGFALTLILLLKMGKSDERTNHIHLKSTLIILYVVIFLDVIFPKEYMWQIFFLFKYSFAFIASGIYLAVRYIKDYSS